MFKIKATCLDISQELVLGTATTCIYQGRMAIKVDWINGGIFRGCELISANLENFFCYLHAIPGSYT